MRKRDTIRELLRILEQERAAHRDEIRALLSRIAAVQVFPSAVAGNATGGNREPEMLYDEDGFEAVPKPPKENP